MSLLDKIRNKPQAEKIRLMWTVIVVVAALLIVLWIFTTRIGKTGPADTTLFQKIGEGFKNVKDNYKK